MNGASHNSDQIGKYAAIQSVAEMTLGSIVHSMSLPLGGHLLSLNQGLILILASKKATHRRECISSTNGIASVAAFLKTLSPAGKRLIPMLAISVQGLLFSLGVAVLGLNLAGIIAGMILLSLWGFVQPLLLAYLLFGKSFFEAIQKIWLEIAQALHIAPSWGIGLLLGVVAIKAIAAVIIAVVVRRGDAQMEVRYLEQVKRLKIRQANPKRPAWVNPWFMVSLVLSVGFFVLSNRPSQTEILLYALRIIAVTWLAFWSIRLIPLSWIERWFGPSISTAIAHLKQFGRDTDSDLVGVVATQREPDRATELG